jgi:hypothetical protein
VFNIIPPVAAIENLVINGGMDFFQRQAFTTPTSRADDTYAADRFYVLTQSNPINTERVAGDKAAYASRLTQANASAQRMGYAQIVEGSNSTPYRGRTVRLQGAVNISTSQAVRFALLEWTGTLDSPTSDVVNNWASSTYTAGNFFISSNLTVPSSGVGSITPAGSTWTRFGLNVTLSTSLNNLILMIWTEGTAAQNFTLDISEVGIYPGTTNRLWSPPPIAVTREMCNRYFEMTYPHGTPPGTVSTNGIEDFYTRKAIAGSTAGGIAQGFMFQTPKRTTPTVTLYSSTTGASGTVRVGANARSGATAGQVGDRKIGNLQFDNSSAQAVALDDEIFFQWAADAEL